MVFSDALFIVTSSVHDQFDAFPLDPDDEAAVRRVLATHGNTDRDTIVAVARLEILDFMDNIDVGTEWPRVQDALWRKILVRAKLDLTTNPPADWGPGLDILSLTLDIF